MSEQATPASRAAAVARVLRGEILRGQYRAGERLPSERELAGRFETNRGAVREALKQLEQIGIIATHPGGVRVLPIEEASLSVLGHLLELDDVPNLALIDQTLEVFSAMVGVSARSALEVADEAQIGTMRSLTRSLLEAPTAAARHMLWRDLFACFVGVNGNLVMRLIGNGLAAQFNDRFRHLAAALAVDTGLTCRIIRRIDEAIVRRDGASLGEAVQDHFRLLRDRLAGLQPGDLQRPSACPDSGAGHHVS